jgi:hypothetical protein
MEVVQVGRMNESAKVGYDTLLAVLNKGNGGLLGKRLNSPPLCYCGISD